MTDHALCEKAVRNLNAKIDKYLERIAEIEAELQDTRHLLFELEEVSARKQDRLDVAEANLARVGEWEEGRMHMDSDDMEHLRNYILSDTRKPLAVVDRWANPRALLSLSVKRVFDDDTPVTVIVMPRESEGE